MRKVHVRLGDPDLDVGVSTLSSDFSGVLNAPNQYADSSAVVVFSRKRSRKDVGVVLPVLYGRKLKFVGLRDERQ